MGLLLCSVWLSRDACAHMCNRLTTTDTCKLLTLVIYSLHVFNTFRKACLFIPSNFCKTNWGEPERAPHWSKFCIIDHSQKLQIKIGELTVASTFVCAMVHDTVKVTA